MFFQENAFQNGCNFIHASMDGVKVPEKSVQTNQVNQYWLLPET